jgi:hypothetical protein
MLTRPKPTRKRHAVILCEESISEHREWLRYFSTGTGYRTSTVTMNVDHELLRNLLINANAGYENDAFQKITRNDNVFHAGAGVKYLVNRNLYLGVSNAYQQRSSRGRYVDGLETRCGEQLLRSGVNSLAVAPPRPPSTRRAFCCCGSAHNSEARGRRLRVSAA